MDHRELGYKVLEGVVNALADIAQVDQEPKMAGKQLTMSVRYSPSAKAKNP